MPIDLKGFVHNRERAASPQQVQNGPPTKDRRAIAANAKVAMKKPSNQTQQLQMSSGIPSRGLGNAQNSSAAVQDASHRTRPGQGNKADMYDTDADSIDTTVNQSVIQVEHSQLKMPQHHQRHEIEDYRSEDADEDEDEAADDDDDGEGDEDEDFPITQSQAEFLQQEGKIHLDTDEALAYLARFRPGGFPIVDGDSYPSTTEGERTEWRGEQGLTLESPSPRQAAMDGHRPMVQPAMHRQQPRGDPQPMHSSNKIFKQSANIRDQQRVNAYSNPQLDPVHQSMAVPVQSSQPPSYSQVKDEFATSLAVDADSRPYQLAFNQASHTFPPQQPGPARTQATRFTGGATHVLNQPTSTAHNNIVPIIKKTAPVEQVTVQHPVVRPTGDYDPEVLAKMSYDQLKSESFDTSPRSKEPPLSENMLQKPLIERLEHVQKNFDDIKQSEFFRSLPTREWEDAGDWFLDQFSSIIDRTKQARKQKRKLAQGFEDEIEKRHKHVSKKQRQVNDAFAKMQEQGEGLVPKSLVPSKSPKPKKR